MAGPSPTAISHGRPTSPSASGGGTLRMALRGRELVERTAVQLYGKAVPC